MTCDGTIFTGKGGKGPYTCCFLFAPQYSHRVPRASVAWRFNQDRVASYTPPRMHPSHGAYTVAVQAFTAALCWLEALLSRIIF